MEVSAFRFSISPADFAEGADFLICVHLRRLRTVSLSFVIFVSLWLSALFFASFAPWREKGVFAFEKSVFHPCSICG